MPYIPQKQRSELDVVIEQFPELDDGQLNYVMTKLAHKKRYVTVSAWRCEMERKQEENQRQKQKSIVVDAWDWWSNGDITAGVHRIKALRKQGYRVKVSLQCQYCCHQYVTEDFTAYHSDGRFFIVFPRASNGQGIVHAICPECGIKTQKGSTDWSF